MLAANEGFYRAFAAGDMRAMTDLWAPHDELVCVHPGHPCLFGRGEVLASWFAILESPPPVRMEDPRAHHFGDTGFVSCVERIGENRLAATNYFQWDGGAWRMVHHQASHIVAGAGGDAASGSRGGTVH